MSPTGQVFFLNGVTGDITFDNPMGDGLGGGGGNKFTDETSVKGADSLVMSLAGAAESTEDGLLPLPVVDDAIASVRRPLPRKRLPGS